MYHCFLPGKVWLDTEGKRIQAHGGSLFYENGIYYWYGENKEKTDGVSPIWHWGVRCYSSTDLYNWEDQGLIIPPEPEDVESSLHPNRCMDRPHIIYNKKTKKYVCWLKIMNQDQTQSMTVLTADEFLGPYTKVHDGMSILNMSSGDFDLVVADDGKAYIYFERVHSEMICADLTDDYLGVTGYYSTHFPRQFPPYVREAPAHFIRKGKHYLITSGTTNYSPNPSEAAVAETWHGPYKVLGNPHPADKSHTSFHSQISCIFKVPGKKDLYIAMADRWLPILNDTAYEDYADAFEAFFNPEMDIMQVVQKMIQKTGELPEDGKIQEYLMKQLPVPCTKDADYVWLPIQFDGDMPILNWKDEWSLEDYE